MSESETRELRRGVFGLRKKIKGEEQVAQAELDDALDKLSAALLENTVTCARVRRRQSSGSIKIVAVPEAGE
jgi:hypothetical protein